MQICYRAFPQKLECERRGHGSGRHGEVWRGIVAAHDTKVDLKKFEQGSELERASDAISILPS